MDRIVKQLLEGQLPDRIFPFLWMHGEDEPTLRMHMRVIKEAGMSSVCLESRPHPDFAGEGWWRDLDVILDEAKALGMHIYILDDSHFPTGYANGALKNAPAELCRQSLVRVVLPCISAAIPISDKAPAWQPNLLEQYSLPMQSMRTFDDDRLLAVLAVKKGGRSLDDILDLTEEVRGGELVFRAPKGKWSVQAFYLTRNRGPHRDHINMMDARSVQTLIDAVYEPHYRRYRQYFGNLIAGFFSDEPELGNGHLYEYGKKLCEMDDQAWSAPLEDALRERWGEDFAKRLPLLWEEAFSAELSAAARYDYMDEVTRLVSENFSCRIGDWCAAHGVEHIGHVIEDNGQDTRTGSGLGHFFRAESGQSMAGIDDIGGQVLPQGEWAGAYGVTGEFRDGLFYHFVLGKLASSAAAVQGNKRGRAMCEIFGNYGWEEGVRLEKYLVDHFLVRGINAFVPHAFSLKPFPDPDCPPHFYAHGNDPLFRHFGALMRYTNRLAGLFGSGKTVAPVAVLYHAEAEWMGKVTPPAAAAEALLRHQIDFTFLPADVFSSPEAFGTHIGESLTVNGRDYQCLVFPGAERLPASAVEGAAAWAERGGKVYFLDAFPKAVYDGKVMRPFVPFGKVVPARALPEALAEDGVTKMRLTPACKDVRVMRVSGEHEMFFFVNEGRKPWRGRAFLPVQGSCYGYDAWENRLTQIGCTPAEGGCELALTLEPLKSVAVIVDEPESGVPVYAPVRRGGRHFPLKDGWRRTMCRSIDYPAFHTPCEVCLPDRADRAYPKFSGIYRYEREIYCERTPRRAVLEITEAHECVEVIVNGMRAGLRIAPPYLYDITGYLCKGKNRIVIEVATTLERELSDLPDPARLYLGLGEKVVTTPSGLDGEVNLYLKG